MISTDGIALVYAVPVHLYKNPLVVLNILLVLFVRGTLLTRVTGSIEDANLAVVRAASAI